MCQLLFWKVFGVRESQKKWDAYVALVHQSSHFNTVNKKADWISPRIYVPNMHNEAKNFLKEHLINFCTIALTRYLWNKSWGKRIHIDEKYLKNAGALNKNGPSEWKQSHFELKLRGSNMILTTFPFCFKSTF